MNWSSLPLLFFGLLNLSLVFVSLRRVKGATGVALMFAGAAGLIWAGLWRSNPPMTFLGCLLSLLAPVWMGFLLHGKPTPAHHVVRLLLVTLCFVLWISFSPA
ncbi:hypothetical protein Dxin01_00585 [Deinococcus xinjiangensis]|uniref:Uncharacterized protein n=1 Tax=Deinococcus xinjiangensis TaxID=457454 RepID=A0ABP9VAY0_9DEIO